MKSRREYTNIAEMVLSSQGTDAGKLMKVVVNGDGSFIIRTRYNDEKDIVIDTTVASILGCDNEVWVSPLHIAKICVDQNCHLKIHCPQNSSLVVYYWCDDANIEVVEGKDRVSLRKK